MPRAGGGRSSGGGGGSRSSGGGGGSVSVSGYTRSNGTYVSGYTRAAPSSSSSSSSTGGGGGGGSSSAAASASYASSSSGHGGGGGGGSVNVSGYTRSNGTYVSGYTRAAPSNSSSATSGADHGVVHVKEHTRSNGTVVAAHTRSKPAASRSAAASGANDVVHVKEHTRSDGTVVAAHTRSRPTRNLTEGMAEALPSVDIKQGPAFPGDNRKRTHFVDNPVNRRKGRVGLPIPSKRHTEQSRQGLPPDATSSERQHERIKDALYRTTVEEIRLMLTECAESILDRQATWEENNAIQTALHHHQRAEVEEEWSEQGVPGWTDLQRIRAGRPGDTLVIQQDEITLEKAIGRGGFGEVFAARYKGTVVAVKRLHLQSWSRSRLDTFKRELQVLSQVQHQHVVAVLGVVLEPPQFSIVMEYLSRSLFTALFIHEEQFSGDKQKMIVLEVCAALEHLHKEGIAHCDMKVENVLLDATDHAKICDFGLSFIRSTTEVSSSRLDSATAPPGQGTPRYSAPEVLRGERLVLKQLFATDVYSLALVVYEVVVRKEVFIDYTLRQLEKNVGDGEDRPEISAPPRILADTIQQLWVKDPSRRPTMARVCELFSAIDSCHWAPLNASG
ncbi:serine/threonine-protein kinase TNNI3K-like [Sycon ciliatum]|uniref:serine/threonine-protein kinase TNNI3K-like n=1 Tax=Sycon ciliatum TaxID=27933 RepID=UPI0031F6D295